MERLSHFISREVINGRWKPIQLGANGPGLSHLFFADDLILFSKDNFDQVTVIDEVLGKFCSCSGQKLSKQKSLVFFSRNVKDDIAVEIGKSLDVNITNIIWVY